MSEPFTDDWMQRVVAAAPAELSDVADSISVSFTALGGPDGDAPTTWRLQGGKLSVEPVADADADVTFALAWNDTMAILRGDLEPSVVYMRGALKTSGNMAVALRVLKASSTPAFKAWRESI